jgi:hypothetical protein
LKHLLACTTVVYAGRLDEMAKIVTKMTWLEELLFFYELRITSTAQNFVLPRGTNISTL